MSNENDFENPFFACLGSCLIAELVLVIILLGKAVFKDAQRHSEPLPQKSIQAESPGIVKIVEEAKTFPLPPESDTSTFRWASEESNLKFSDYIQSDDARPKLTIYCDDSALLRIKGPSGKSSLVLKGKPKDRPKDFFEAFNPETDVSEIEINTSENLKAFVIDGETIPVEDMKAFIDARKFMRENP